MSPSEPGSQPRHGIAPRNSLDGPGVQLRFPAIRLSFPCLFDVRVGVKTGNQPFQQVRSIGRVQFQDLRLQGF